MSTRTAKQLIYGALYLVIIFVVLTGIYFIFIRPFTAAPAVICTPSTCAPTSTAPLSGTLVSTFTTTPGDDTFLGQITNADDDFGAADVNYQVDLDDASGSVLQSIPGQTFIYGNQTKYVLLPNIAVGQLYDHAVLSVASASWIASSTLGANPTPGSDSAANSTFGILNVAGSMGSTTVAVSGEITNASIVSYEQVIVMVLFKNVNGDIVGASKTELDNVGAGEMENFSVIYPASPAVDPNLNQVIVYAIR